MNTSTLRKGVFMALSDLTDSEFSETYARFRGNEFFDEYGDPTVYLELAEDSDLVTYYFSKGRAFAAAIIKSDCVLMLTPNLKDKEVLRISHHLALAGYKKIVAANCFGDSVIHDFVSKGKRPITLMNVDRAEF